MGRASKNSCANMKGVLEGSFKGVSSVSMDAFKEGRVRSLPLGKKRMSSHHVMPRFEYLLVL